MANKDNFKALKVIQDFQAEVTPIVKEYATSEQASLAVASALLGTLVPLYKDSFGTERTAVMLYKVADDLACEVPPKINIRKKRIPTRKRKK